MPTREELEQDDFDLESAEPAAQDVNLEDDVFELDFDDSPEEEPAPVEIEEATQTVEEEEVPEEEEAPAEDAPEEEAPEEEEEDEMFTPFVNLLLEKEVLAIDPEKDYEDSEEGFMEIIQDTVANRLKERMSSLPEDVQRLIEIAEKGGDLREAFQEQYSFDYGDIDMSDESNQVELVREHLIAQGHEEADALEMIDDLKDLNKLNKHAATAQKYFVQKQSQEREAYVGKVEAQRVAREQEAQQRMQEIEHKIDTIEAFGAFQNVPKQEREAFKKYLFEVGEDGKTQAQRDNSVENILATEFNKFKKFDYSGIERRAQTKTTINWKKKAQRVVDTNQEAKSSGTRRYVKPEDPETFALGELDD